MSVHEVSALFDASGLEETFLQSPHFSWTLRLGSWRPTGPSRGCVVILPGRGDFLEKYAHVARFLNAHGYGVYTLDWPGQGGSERLGAARAASTSRTHTLVRRLWRGVW